MPVFTTVSWHSHCESSPGSFAKCIDSLPMHANLQTKTIDFGCAFACRRIELINAGRDSAGHAISSLRKALLVLSV